MNRIAQLFGTRRLALRGNGVLLLLSACTSNPDDHPPFCNEPRCIPVVATKSKGSAGASSVDTGNAAGAWNSAGASNVTLLGKIVEFEETGTSSTTAATTGRFTVTTLATGATSLVTKGLASEFSLPNVARSRAAWLAVTPENRTDLFPGIVAFDSSSAVSPPNVLVNLVRRTDLESLAMGLTSMVTLDTTKAQVVVRFTKATTGVPISGVKVAMAGAAKVAFDLGASYTDDATATSKRGMSVLLNVDATSTPSLRAISLGGTLTGEVIVPLWAGAASVLQVSSL